MSKRKWNSKNELPQKTTQPKLIWYKRMWVVVVAVGSAAFTLGLQGPTLLQNMRKIPGELEKTWDQYMAWLKDDAAWAGDWSTFPEGIVNTSDMRLSEGIDLKITLQAKGGKISGMIASSKICAKAPFNFLLLRGTVSGNVASVEVWDIVEGHSWVFEHLKLVREGVILTVHPALGEFSWFPQEARLGKHPEVTETFMDGFCKDKVRPKGISKNFLPSPSPLKKFPCPDL